MSRRLVAVLFLDLVGWTRLAERLDPEPLQDMLEQYYEICSTAVEEHGGVVEKFIGDAIMAVFGTATSQEDDAVRALRTAFQIRDEAGRLRIPGTPGGLVQVHCGVAAGEALVTRSARAGVRIVGDVVNLAARLQSKAVAGEVLVNQTVAHLARPHFDMVPVEPLALKGKAEPVPALRVTGVAAADQPADALRMVDRAGERARLRALYDRVVRERRARVVAVVGPPGIGKTRLVAQTLDELGDAPIVVLGSCPSYGVHSSYAALVQVLDALVRGVAPCGDLTRADGRLATVLEGLRDATRARRDATAPGPAGSGPRSEATRLDGAGLPGPGVEEVSWAARELLAAATDRPLVVVWDSLECAGESLLRLIGELAGALRDAPLLMVCVGRPELAAAPVPWVGDLLGRDVIEVGALAPADSVELAAALATGSEAEVLAHDIGLVDRVAAYSAGNPLFIRLLVESASPGRPLDEVPATITAMVGAMLDRLPPPARQLLGAASVIGPTFTLEQLGFLDETAAGIDALLERRLVRADDEDGRYRVTQQPVHEVAYGRLEKDQRYRWHRRLAEHGVHPAFHLEAAARLLRDLRPDDPELPDLARLAGRALLGEGTAALRQRDVPAAIALLERTLALAPDGPDPLRAVAAIRLSDALLLTGDIRRAMDVVAGGPDGSGPLPCRVQLQLLAARLGEVPGGAVDSLRAELDGAPDDRLARCRFVQLLMLLHLRDGRFGAAERAANAALAHARAIGDEYEEDRLLAALCEVRQWSPTPVADTLAGCAELVARFAGDRFLLVPVLAAMARCLALTGDPAGARAALAEASAAVEQLRLTMGRILVDQAAGLACALDDDPAGAERHYRAAADALDEAGHVAPALTLRVQAERERARPHPATAGARIAALLDRRAEMDARGRLLCLSAAVRWPTGDGVPVTARGDVEALLGRTDDPCLRGDVYFDLAQADRHRGRHDEAAAMAAAAIDNYHRVGATRPIRKVRAWM